MKNRVTTLLCSLVLVIVMAGSSPAAAQQQDTRIRSFMMSLAVPGLGQYLNGSTGYATAFFAAELALWGGYYYTTIMKEGAAQDYYLMAAHHAGTDPHGHGTAYLNAVGLYMSSFDYNQSQLQRMPYPVLYGGDMAWQWDTQENRIDFRLLREHELDYENNAKYCIAGIVLNHFLSALNAANMTRTPDAHVSVLGIRPIDGGLKATYLRSF